jgi:hypothetical protein
MSLDQGRRKTFPAARYVFIAWGRVRYWERRRYSSGGEGGSDRYI